MQKQATNEESPTKCAQSQAAKLAVVIARLAKQEVLGLGSWVSYRLRAQLAVVIAGPQDAQVVGSSVSII